MKTLFVVSEMRVNAHAGEEYDYILEVADQPTLLNIQELASRVRTRIRSMWKEQQEAGDPNPCVACYLDGASPYNTMLIDLQFILGNEEKIKVELPYLPKDSGPSDPEAREWLEKIGKTV